MLKNLKLRERILLGYSIPLLLSIGSATVVYISTNQVKEEVRTAEIGATLLRQSERMALSIALMNRAVRDYTIQGQSEVENGFQIGVDKFENAAVLLEENVIIEEQKQRLAKILDLGRATIASDRNIISLVQQNKTAEALELYRSPERKQLIQDLEAAVQELNAAEEQIQDGKVERSQDVLKFLSQVVFLTTGIAILVALTLGWAIATRISETLKDTATTIASSSTEIAATSEQQERVAKQQATAVHQTTTTMDELAASSRESADRAESTTAQVEQIACQIQHLSEQVNQIDKIANLVSDIANQTNMLALNAAVEAVRAGDSGKGFGVVASEIRKLADRSKQSADKISTLVVDIENATNSAVVVSKDGTRNIESMVAAVNHIAVNAQQISLSAKQQALATQQVVDAMNSLNRTAQETASGIAQTKVSIQQLNTVALKLKNEV